MTNVKLLKEKIDQSGLKMNFIAEKLNMTPQGLYKKLADCSNWFYSQEVIIKNLLRLSDEEVNLIFFADRVDR